MYRELKIVFLVFGVILSSFQCNGQIDSTRVIHSSTVDHITRIHKVIKVRDGYSLMARTAYSYTETNEVGNSITREQIVSWSKDSVKTWKILSNLGSVLVFYSYLGRVDTLLLYNNNMVNTSKIVNLRFLTNIYSRAIKEDSVYFSSFTLADEDIILSFNTDTLFNSPFANYQIRLDKKDLKIKSLVIYNVYQGQFVEFSRDVFVYSRDRFIWRSRSQF